SIKPGLAGKAPAPPEVLTSAGGAASFTDDTGRGAKAKLRTGARSTFALGKGADESSPRVCSSCLAVCPLGVLSGFRDGPGWTGEGGGAATRLMAHPVERSAGDVGRWLAGCSSAPTTLADRESASRTDGPNVSQNEPRAAPSRASPGSRRCSRASSQR